MKFKALSFLLILVALARMAATFTVFSATADEPMHISAGLQLLTQHRNAYQLENPPLPRVILAFAPWRGGMQFDSALTLSDQLARVFYTGGSYTRNLVLARSGNLIFFAIAAIFTWLWARRLLDDRGAFLATLLFTTQPILLGYSALATHDAPATAGTAVALFAFSCWLDRSTIGRAIGAGAAFGFAVACKFSCIGYVPAACIAMYCVHLTRSRALRRDVAHLFIAAAACILAVWTSYGFTVGTFLTGIEAMIATNRDGHLAYLFGRTSLTGWWWYYPAAIALKTTLGSLLILPFAWLARRDRALLEPLAASIAILAVAMSANLDLGIRYLLPLYIPLSVATAAILMTMLTRRTTRIVAAALLLWHCAASVLAHPDYFPYFNELAARNPSRYLIDSNLDWGQDVLRLARVVRAEKIDRIGVVVMGLNDLQAHGIPAYFPNAFAPVNGWIAVSEHAYRMMRVDGGWSWLDHQPYRRVGKSIRLYYLP